MQNAKIQKNQNSRKNLYILVECAVMVALAVVLSYFKIYNAPLGGSVTLFSMVPVIIIGLRHGPFWGFATAFVYSLTQFMFDVSKLSGWGVAGAKNMLICILFDYIIAFTILGVSGFFKPAVDKTPQRSKKIIVTVIAALTVCVLRYISHLISGAVLWYSITKAWSSPDDYIQTVGAWVYSAVYNMQYMLPETIITLIAAPAVVTILSVINNQRKNSAQ